MPTAPKQVYPLNGISLRAVCPAILSTVVAESSFPVIQSIELPNGTYYNFKYDPTYGLLNEIDYPDGGKVVYTWGWSDTQ